MESNKNSKNSNGYFHGGAHGDTQRKRTGFRNGINLDYDYNSEYGDGDIPDIDKPHNMEEDPEDYDYNDRY